MNEYLKTKDDKRAVERREKRRVVSVLTLFERGSRT